MKETTQLAVWTKLTAVVCSSIFVAFHVEYSWVLALMGLASLAYQRNFWVFLYSACFYGALSLLVFFGRRHELAILSVFHLRLLWQLMPVILTSIDLLSTPPGKLAGFLSSLGLPCRAILAVYVLFRFFPMVKQEFFSVWHTMRSRRLATVRQFFLHPFRFLEHLLVPLLLRLLQSADQMTVSAVTRGATAPGTRSSLYSSALSADDGFWILAWVLLLGFWIWGKLR